MRKELIASSLLLISIVAVLAGVVWLRVAETPGAQEPGVIVFNLTGIGSGGVWTLDEVQGVNYWWRKFQPAVLHIPLHSRVVINLRSADVFHRFYIPELSVGPVDVEPGHMVTVRFEATRSGIFQYYCSTMCGTCHFYMRGWVVITPPGETPVEPPPLVCGLCIPVDVALPSGASMLDLGAHLYQQKGCLTCHGPEGRGKIPNVNSAKGVVPDHETTAEKLFIRSPEDAALFIELIESKADIDLEDDPGIVAFPAVVARYENAKEIIRKGRYTSKRDPGGPEPPLQMPAWQHLIDERQIDAILAYFVSLYDWEDA